MFLGVLDRTSDMPAAREEMRKLSARFSQRFSDIRRFASRLTALIEEIDRAREGPNLLSALRVAVLADALGSHP